MPVLKAEDVEAALRKGGPASVEADVPARFKPGDRVVVRNLNPTGHTRAPRYIRCKQGAIDRVHGVFAYPDSRALGAGDSPQRVYSVRFSAREVWGPGGASGETIYLDLWDDYLDAA